MLWLRLLRESFLFAWSAIWVNKLRTFLSLLGVMVGIFMISAVFAVVDSLEDNLRGTFDILDADVLFVQKWPWSNEDDYPWWTYMQRPESTLREAEGLEDRLTLAQAVAYQETATVSPEAEGNFLEGVELGAVTHAYDRVISLDIAYGRYFTDAESDAGRAVAVIGDDVAQVLFGRSNAVGKRLKIRGTAVEVVGVFRKEGASLFGNGMDRMILVPAQLGDRVIAISNGSEILVKCATGATNPALRAEVTRHMRAMRGLAPGEEDDFSINEMDMLTGILDTIFVQVEVGGWFIGLFAILVGCFSIANIMFVSVRERTRIIGIQKAIGARSRFILMQFLFEAVALCVFGALFALAAIGLLVVGINAADLGFELSMHPARVLMALGVAIVSGLIAGVAPARAASRMEPVEAMRQGG
jgi:putative ABC transport system permease protein